MNDRDKILLKGIERQGQLLIAALSVSISGFVFIDFAQTDNPVIFCDAAFEEMTGYNQ